MGYNTGFAAVQESIKQAAERSAGGKYAHPIELLWNASWKKDGDKKFVRFLSDNVVVFPMHTYVPTKDGKHKDFACTAALEGELQRPCFICNNMTKSVKDQQTGQNKEIPSKPTAKTIGVVVERGENSDGTMYDITREMELLVDANKPEGPTHKVDAPQLSILSQGNTFWDTMNGYYVRYKTIVDRDYEITRRGEGLNTKYTIIATDKDTETGTAKALWDLYGIPREGKQDPIQQAIIDWIERRGTVEYFDRYLNTGNAAPAGPDPEEDNGPTEAPRGTGFAGLRQNLARDYPETVSK